MLPPPFLAFFRSVAVQRFFLRLTIGLLLLVSECFFYLSRNLAPV